MLLGMKDAPFLHLGNAAEQNSFSSIKKPNATEKQQLCSQPNMPLMDCFEISHQYTHCLTF